MSDDALPAAEAIEPDEEPDRPSRLRGLYPILLGAYPVLFLWSQNLGETSVGEAVPPLAAAAAAAGIATVVLGLLFRDIRRGALIVGPIAIGLGLYGHFVSLMNGTLGASTEDLEGPVTATGSAGSGNELLIGIVILVVVGLAVAMALRLGSWRLRAVDDGLLRLSAILVAITLVPIGLNVGESALAAKKIKVDPTLPATTSALKRDVYWLIFDRYGSNRSLSLRYGYDNPMSDWLRDRGFTVLADSHANYQKTALSISTTANMAPLDQLPGYIGPQSSSLRPVYGALQRSLTARQFRALGYRYIHLGSWWTPTTKDAGADVNYTYADASDFDETLIDSSAIPALADLAGLESAVPTRLQRHYDNGRYELDVLDGLRDEAGPKFVFAHILLPHPPYVFNLDGSFSAKENGEQSIVNQIIYTNGRLQAILEHLLALPKARQPIIILQADEGPYPRPYIADLCCFDWSTATSDELEMKYGVMNAWYLPDGTDLGLYPTMSSINTFPTLFDRYFGLDYPRWPDHSFTSKDDKHPFELTDITTRLPSLAGAP